MYVYFDGDWIEAISVFRTPYGYEVELKSQDRAEIRGPATKWPCPHCKAINSMFRRTCWKCGKHPHVPK